MWMIATLVFMSSFLVVSMLARRFMGPTLIVGERLASYAMPASRVVTAPGRWSGIPAINRLMSRASHARGIELLLEQADLPIKPFELVLITAICGMAGGLVGLLLGARQAAFTQALLLAVMTALGGLIPLTWVYLRRRFRRHAFTRQLPDALQAISGALRAGMGFTQGMTIVATNLPAPISVEFARALREMNLGTTVEEVLQNMARRIQSLDFDLAVSGILINRQVGGNLAELLDTVVATLRERVRLKGFIRVLTAQQRLSAWVILAVPPVILLVLLFGMPEYSRYLVMTRVGQGLLALAFFMQILGGYFIRRIVSIDV